MEELYFTLQRSEVMDPEQLLNAESETPIGFPLVRFGRGLLMDHGHESHRVRQAGCCPG